MLSNILGYSKKQQPIIQDQYHHLGLMKPHWNAKIFNEFSVLSRLTGKQVLHRGRYISTMEKTNADQSAMPLEPVLNVTNALRL